jgi:phosphate-selective porin
VIVPLLVVVLGSGGLTTFGAWHGARPGLQQDPQAQSTTEKRQKKNKKEKKEKKKAKKAASGAPAPDEINDDLDQAPDATEPGVGVAWKQHPSIRIGDAFRLDFQAKLQEDLHSSYPGAPGLDCPNQALPTSCMFQLHRNRIGIKGTIFKKIEYEVERELTEQELSDKDILRGFTPKPQWKDVNVNVKYMKKAQIQVGRFKVPFGLDELTSVSHNDFVYRSLGAIYLDPGRDIGGMVHGSFFKRGLTYAAGVFQHDGDHARSKKVQGGDQTVAGRVTFAPFRRAGVAGDINVGSAFAVSSLSDDPYLPNGLRGRTILTQDAFFQPVYVKGRRERWEADIDWTAGPASARAEYTWVTDGRLRQGIGDEDLPDARARSWYIGGTWILTGESKKRPLRTSREFLQGGFGAVEVAARYEQLWFGGAGGADVDLPSRTPRAANIFPSGDRALTLGVNWALNRWIKLQFNGIREQVDDPTRNPMAGGGAFWSQVVRFQIVM